MIISELVNIDTFNDIIIDPSLREGFMLGDILVFPSRSVIVKQDEHHHVSAKAMEVLFVLSCNAGSVLSRKALLEYLWGDKKGSSSKLSPIVTELRHLLDDSKDFPRFIQTLPRRGFRFLVMPLPLDESTLSTDVLKAAEHFGHKTQDKATFKLFGGINYWRKSRLFKVAGTYIVMAWVLMQVVTLTLPVVDAAKWFDKLALLIMIVGFPLVLIYNWWTEFKLRKDFNLRYNGLSNEPKLAKHAYRDLTYISVLSVCSLVIAILLGNQVYDAASQIDEKNVEIDIKAKFYPNAVAVMPFRQLGDKADDYVVGLLQSEMLTFLSQSSQLRVISERVLASLPADSSLGKIRDWTGAKYVLEGIINIQGAQVNIMTTLIDSQSGLQVWANKSKVQSTDQLTLYEGISHLVFNALTFLMPQEETSKFKFKPTNDIHAYDFYVRAKGVFKDAYNETQLLEAEQLFLSALGRDSNFELARAGLCQTYLEQYSLKLGSQVFDLARQSCQKVNTESNVKAESEIALGRLYFESGKYSLAQEHFYSALELQPDNSLGLIGLGQSFTRLGQAKQGEIYFLKALQAEPGYWKNYEKYGFFLFEAGRYFEASLQFNKQSVLQPNSEEAFNNLGAAFYLNTEFDKATQSWRKALSIKPSANIYSNLGTSLFFSSKFIQAVEMYQQAVNLSPNNYVFRGNLADALKYAGNQQVKSLQQYKAALNLALKNESINPSDQTIKSNIARYNSELDKCQAANNQSEQLLLEQPDDPYIYYDLALAANNCSTDSDVLLFLKKTLTLGYSNKLLSKDHQFEKFQQQISKW
jgi:tetratricopeptide (TPR) repeat protein/DNA-binding winged helix-turn-helix (wHTH) protein